MPARWKSTQPLPRGRAKGGRLSPRPLRAPAVLGACLAALLLAALPGCAPAPQPEAAATPTATPAPATDEPALPLTAAATAATPTAGWAASPLPTATAPLPTSIPPAAAASPVYTYRVIRAYPHDITAYTEGLVRLDGVLYEGTGLVGRSSIRRVDLETGQVLQSRALPEPHFGEGIAVFGDAIFQLTWKSRKGFVYDRETFDLERTFPVSTQGWGLTTDGRHLIMSDGTATLHFLDPETLEELFRIEVLDDQGPVIRLNELEYVEGEVWANVWLTDRIVRIDPATGRVAGVIDLTGLLDRSALTSKVDVLNGIAYDASEGRLLVTGKLWPWLFEIEVVPSGDE